MKVPNHIWKEMAVYEQDELMCLSLNGSIIYNEDGTNTIMMGSKACQKHTDYINEMIAKYSAKAEDELNKLLGKGGLKEQIKTNNKTYYAKLTCKMLEETLKDLMSEQSKKESIVNQYCSTVKKMVTRNSFIMNLCGNKECKNCTTWGKDFQEEMKKLANEYGK